MTLTMSADFATRREAEMAVEHLVQEYDFDRKAVTVTTTGDANTVGTEPAGGDVEDGHGHEATDPRPALEGMIRVSVEADEAVSHKVRASFENAGGTPVQGAAAAVRDHR